MVKNRYIYHSRISEAKCREILRLFSIDLNATQISELTNISRNSIHKILKALRIRIAMLCEQNRVFDGEVEVDESFFGAKRVKGKRGRGAYGKTIVFGIYKRNGKVYTRIIPNCSTDTLQEIIKGKVNLNSTIHSDNWKGYDGLVDLGYKKHYRLDHSKDEFVRGSSHINGIEGFWGYAKNRLSKFKGMHKNNFYLHLKESEFRFNYRKLDLYKFMLQYLKLNPLKLS